MRTIKRYKNRRLYDMQESRTITQADLAQMIKDGEQLEVIDSASGEDISLAVLGRVMAREADAWEDPNQSKELLRRIIELGGTKSMSILKNTVLASIGAFQVTKQKAEKIVNDLIKKGELSESDRKTAVLELLEKAEKSTAGWRKKISTEVGKASKEVGKLADDIKDYKLVRASDITKLENKVARLTKSIKSIEKKLDEA